MSTKIKEISGELEEFKNREAALAAALENFEDLAESDVEEVPSEHQAAPTSRVAKLLTFGDTVEWQEPDQPGTRSGVIVWCDRCRGGVGEGTSFQYKIRIAATDDTESIVVFVPHAWLSTGGARDGDTAQAAAQEPAGGGGACLSEQQIAEVEERMSHNAKLLGLLQPEDLKNIAKSNGLKSNLPHMVQSLADVLNIGATAASLNGKSALYETVALGGDTTMPVGDNGEKLDWGAFRQLYFAHTHNLLQLLQAYDDYGKYYDLRRLLRRLPAETAEETAGGTCPSIS